MAQELKARMLGQTMNEYGCDTKIYLKSEADKVIAEKDEEIDKQKWRGDEWAKACNQKDKEIAELKEERRWRKCSEELPSHDTWCLVYHEGEIDADHYTDDCNSHDRFVMYGPFVTHWMPLPKAPEE